jgi:hypothetical protein
MVPSIAELLLPTFAAVEDAGGEATNDQIREAVARTLALPADMVARTYSPMGSRTEREYRLAWARTRLEATGPRRWRLTASGKGECMAIRGASVEEFSVRQ